MPIYKHKETGKTVVVLPGTRLPKVYVEVKRGAATKNDKPANEDKTKDEPKPETDNKEKKATGGKSTNAKTNKNDKPANDKGTEEKK